MTVLPRVLMMNAYVQDLVKLPESDFDIEVLSDHADRDDYLRRHGAGITALVATGVERLDAARLDLLPDLRLISVIAAGMSGIDLEAARARGVAVTNAGALNAGDVADMAITMMLTVRRDIIACYAYVREGKWMERRMPPGRSISAERIGIVGLGHIGRAVAERLVPFGCDVRWWGPNPKPDAPWRREEDLRTLSEWASTLFIAVAGNDDTAGLIDTGIIHALGPDGLIGNVSRGFVIDEAAMLAALRDGSLGWAALDVFDREPDDGTKWAGMANVLLAPHVGGATKESFAKVMEGARDNVIRLFNNQPLQRRVV